MEVKVKMDLFKFFSSFFKISVSKTINFEGIVSESTMNKFSTKNKAFVKFSIIKGENNKGNKLIYGFIHNVKPTYLNCQRTKTKCKINIKPKIHLILRC